MVRRIRGRTSGTTWRRAPDEVKAHWHGHTSRHEEADDVAKVAVDRPMRPTLPGLGRLVPHSASTRQVPQG